MKLSLVFLAISFAQTAAPTSIQAVHASRMVVTYQPNHEGKNLLVVEDKPEAWNDKKIEKQRIDLALSKDEILAYHAGFYCTEPSGDRVYAVISSRVAKEVGKFSAQRAWLIDTKKVQLVSVKNPKSITCEWHPEGDKVFPFGKKGS